MSTPVSIDTPARSHLRSDSEQERDLQQKLQHMISLHHVQQTQLEQDSDAVESSTKGGLAKRTTTEAVDLSGMMTTSFSGNEQKLQSSIKGISPIDKNPWILDRKDELPPLSPSQQGVGRGTLHFPSTYDPHNRKNSGDSGVMAMMVASSEAQKISPGQQPPRQIYTDYGALNTNPPPRDSAPPMQQDSQQHEFHYGNPDYHDPYEAFDESNRSRRYRAQDSMCAKFCCLFVPVANLLMEENVHRSFCYGSIDGILTGSGIVSAFCALGVLNLRTSWEVRLAVVVFTAAACLADAICMALGHIWTSFIVSSGHAQERAHERQLMDINKGDAKAKLVEMLMARGMLKIDAMSLADTLEGYPDLFVSVLIGDSLLSAGEVFEGDTESENAPITSGGGGFGSLGSWKFPSYGQFNEIEEEPERAHLRTVLKESQTEGFFMMLGFSIFALFPSVAWLVIPALIPSIASTTTSGDTVSLPSLVVFFSAAIVWSLGVWKSRFMDSQWIMSGVENVCVLLVCVLSAYGVGSALSYCIGGEEGLLLTNVVAH